MVSISLTNTLVIFSIFSSFCALPASANETNFFPGLGGSAQRLQFNSGKVFQNHSLILPELPNIPGPPSSWIVTEWIQNEFLRPNMIRFEDPDTFDNYFGIAHYAFTSPDKHSHVWIYCPPWQTHCTYELYERDGTLTASGGSNIFLSRKTFLPAGVSLSTSLNYEIDAKLVRTLLEASPSAEAQGTVLAQVFSGFIISFPDPNRDHTSTLFLQLPLADSRGKIEQYRSCSISNGHKTITFSGAPSAIPPLPFKPGSGGLQHLSFSISTYLCEFLRQPLKCRDASNNMIWWSPAADQETFTDWKIQEIYIGLETENHDARSGSRIEDSQGTVAVGLQLANPILSTNPTLPFKCAKL